jgi:hypothetical protein
LLVKKTVGTKSHETVCFIRKYTNVMDTKVGKNVSCIIGRIYVQRKYSTPRRFFQDIASNIFQFQGTATHKSLTVQLRRIERGQIQEYIEILKRKGGISLS